jgi:hypothetical protein
VRGPDAIDLPKLVREMSEESAGVMASMRTELSDLRRDAGALGLGVAAARASGCAEVGPGTYCLSRHRHAF